MDMKDINKIMLKSLMNIVDSESSNISLISRSKKTISTYSVDGDEFIEKYYEAEYEELLNKKVSETSLEDNVQESLNKLNLDFVISILKKEKIYSYNLWTFDISGKIRYMNMNFYRGFDDYIILLIRDLTPIGYRINQLNDASQQYELDYKILKKSYSNYLININHDVRTPLNVIVGLLELSKNNDDVDQLKSHLDTIGKTVRNLIKFVEDIFEVTSVLKRNINYTEDKMNVIEENNKLFLKTQEMFDEKNQSFEIIVRNVKHANVIADKDRILKLNVNLLENASKFTSKNGSIRFTYDEIKSDREGFMKLRVSVKDDGIGIKNDVLDRIFIPFEKISVMSENEFHQAGSGVGLPIAKKIIEKYDGKISINSQEGVGTEVIYLIYLRIDEEYINENSKNVYDFRNKRVLLVEDHNINMRVQRRMIEKSGAHVDVARNGLEAIKAHSEAIDGYDLIFMNLDMPVMDGYEATSKIRLIDVYTKIIAITANPLQENKDKAMKSGMDGYILKPFDMNKIKTQLYDIMKNKNNY